MTDRLERYLTAQDDGGTYARALAELRAGSKHTHWMWFVFPQIAGLGRSATAQHFAIADLHEARAYQAHPLLGARLRECTRALLDAGATDPVAVLGGIDAMKLRSSMTLFAAAAPAEESFGAVLERFYGGSADEATARLL